MGNRSASERSVAAQEAWQALGFLDTRVQEDMHGDIDGVDTLDAGLRAMASALARLVDISLPEGMRSIYLEDILDHLVASGLVEQEASKLVRLLRGSITTAMYQGLNDEEISHTNDISEKLHNLLSDLLERLGDGS